jgi:hypothetical protein
MELIALAAFGAALLYWFDSMRARERALRIARTACNRHGFQLLDETVALARIRLRRDENGRVKPFRTYGFEFSVNGGERRTGEVDLIGARPAGVRLDLDYTLHEQA